MYLSFYHVLPLFSFVVPSEFFENEGSSWLFVIDVYSSNIKDLQKVFLILWFGPFCHYNI